MAKSSAGWRSKVVVDYVRRFFFLVDQSRDILFSVMCTSHISCVIVIVMSCHVHAGSSHQVMAGPVEVQINDLV